MFVAKNNDFNEQWTIQCSSGFVWRRGDLRVSRRIVSVETSSLLHCGFCLWFVWCPWWFMDEFGDRRTGRADVCFATVGAGAGVGVPWRRLIASLSGEMLSLWYVYSLLRSVLLSHVFLLIIVWVGCVFGWVWVARFPPFWERVANSACRLGFLWLLCCIYLRFPLMFGAWCGSDCISFSYLH